MDINRIALYLAGKFPPYYGGPFDKYELIELLRAKSPKGFSDDFYKLLDSQDFYSMCLNRIKRADEVSLVEIIKILNVPEDAGGLKKSDLIGERLKELKKEYDDMKIMTDVRARGYKFEAWLVALFNAFDLKPRWSYKTELDQIDGSFELDGKEYLFEAKWLWKEADTGVIDRLFSRLDRCLIWTLWLAISHSWFTDNSITASQRHKNLLLLGGDNLDIVLNGGIALPDLIRRIRRMMAEEWKPYLENNMLS